MCGVWYVWYIKVGHELLVWYRLMGRDGTENGVGRC